MQRVIETVVKFMYSGLPYLTHFAWKLSSAISTSKNATCVWISHPKSRSFVQVLSCSNRQYPISYLICFSWNVVGILVISVWFSWNHKIQNKSMFHQLLVKNIFYIHVDMSNMQHIVVSLTHTGWNISNKRAKMALYRSPVSRFDPVTYILTLPDP